ncbi:MAG: sensor domain-containing diguanylate cyclase, partial [Chloroflexi bacterium]|nr:sensor domain-containing diguanylate cyclase [Chloroflexota bacterium]
FARFPVAGFHNESVVREGRTRLHGSPAEVPEFVTLDITHIRPEWGAYLCVPIKAKGAVLGVMGLFSRHPRTFDDYSLALYHAMGEQVGLALTNARLYERVQQQALTDSLTGVYNRRYLDDFLSHELKRCARYRHGASLIMLDINRFKEYNDTFGHPAGDEALREVADLLRQHVRAADAVARYGGEEFAVVLPETTPASARTAAEKLRAAIEQYAFPHGQLTASLGVATCGHDSEQGADALIRMADQALYQSKRDGRNRVSLWDAESASLPRQTNVLSP